MMSIGRNQCTGDAMTQAPRLSHGNLPVGAFSRRVKMTLRMLVAGLAVGFSTCAAAQTQGLYPDTHHLDATGKTAAYSWGDGSKLAKNDHIVISKPAIGSAITCTSIINNSTVDFFVPWSTDSEWIDFQNAVHAALAQAGGNPKPAIPLSEVSIIPGCCSKETVAKAINDSFPNGICNDGNMVPSSGYGGLLIGERYLGVPLVKTGTGPYPVMDDPNWAAGLDVYTAVASDLLTYLAPAPTYQVTLNCTNSGWVQTNGQDSSSGNCTPLCGSANQQNYDSAPTTNLCTNGGTVANFQSETNPNGWSWKCNSPGWPNGNSCFAYANGGACGSADYYSFAPGTGPDYLCVAGNTASAVTGTGPWYWTCTENGITVGCMAFVIGAQCGSANGYSFPAGTGPDYLCAAGNTASAVTGTGPWYWNCSYGSATVNCSANVLSTTGGGGGGPANGVCGASSGTTIPAAPNVNLCSSGTPSAIAGNGPWTWTCQGTSTSSGTCTANICAACTGSVTVNRSFARNTSGSCSVTGTTTWTETDALSNNVTSAVVSWTDAIGSYSQSETGANAPTTYCPPCVEIPQSISNAKTVISAASGSCPGGVSSGSTVTPSTTPTVQ